MQTTDGVDLCIDRFTRGIIRRKARQLIGRAGFTKQDCEDLEQDLTVCVLQSLRSFDPDRAHCKSFITAVVERGTATLLRAKRAPTRACAPPCSLSETIQVDQEQVELAQTITQRELNSLRGRSPRGDGELAQLKLDVAVVLASLPADERDVAERLERGTPSTVAHRLGLPRSTLGSMLKGLQRRFEASGMRDYL